MFERFTDRARKVMALANKAAQEFNSEYIDTIHVLHGLLKEGSGVGYNVLRNSEELKVTMSQLKCIVHDRVAQTKEDNKSSMGKLPQTELAKKVIEYAIEEARLVNHNYVGSEHILLGLLHSQNNEETTIDSEAYAILTSQGLTLEGVREEVINLLGAGVTPHPTKKVLTRECENCGKKDYCVVCCNINRLQYTIPSNMFGNVEMLISQLKFITATSCSKYESV